MRKVLLVISLEVGLICATVVVSVLTELFSIWAWTAGVAIFDVLIPLGLYHRECIAWCKRSKTAMTSHPPSHPSSEPSSNGSQDHALNELTIFMGCLPHIQRCRKLIEPYTGTLGTVNIGLQVFHSGGAEFGEIATELEYLAKQFSVLGRVEAGLPRRAAAHIWWAKILTGSFVLVHGRPRPGVATK